MVLSAKSLSPSGQPTAEAEAKAKAQAHQSQVYLEVHGIIRATGQFVDDISARYFRGFHHHLPVISRTRFYNNLITLGVAPAADFSVLLLTICLITHAPALGYQSGTDTDTGTGHRASRSVEQQSIYLTARSLFAQVQVSCAPSPSLPLIQAGLLLAVYEYTHGRADDAFVTIAGIARMAYAARIHTRNCPQIQMTHTAGHNADADADTNTNTDLLLHAEEAANTWWGIVICERTFFSEVAVFDQPLVTVFPGGDARLPIEPQVFDQLDLLDPESLPNISVSCLTSPKVGGFCRTAQAACLLDQVLKGLDTPDMESRLLQLDRLDDNIQAFLSLVMPQCQGQPGVFCAAMNIAIRALFTLHWHILDQRPQVVNVRARVMFKRLEEWYQRSQEALDTVTKMVVDIAESLIAATATTTARNATASPTNTTTTTHTVDAMPPIYPYVARAALRHICSSAQRADAGWLRGAENVLQASLDKYSQRWSV
ncbi:hypothetical protein A1O3_02411 [Capronia epimyces CBS 606.96]|uniref:Xylanolytic transcriptional activator regulatory domain-containing protein n=1 Tax=Capronia epimyces CBS 606.96 TaxID=1182542 RepID=W9Z4D9_9EURO|nr:uncharacterized protein A1O3_02411 [Capronia epimyces CBS 606.96]EXJ89344.1 hypothetical protein A1O3_02411 [Capronia epimyces CBS 606.96]